MSDERFCRKDADALTQRIVDGLGRRQQKINRMREWEHSRASQRKMTFYAAVACAACLAIGVLLRPFYPSKQIENNLSVPSFTEWRGVSSDTQQLGEWIDAEQYGEALHLVEKLLTESDSIVRSWSDSDTVVDEEATYERELIRMDNEELRWAYIYILIKMGKKTEAVVQLEYYVQQYPDGEHIDQAKKTLAFLKK